MRRGQPEGKSGYTVAQAWTTRIVDRHGLSIKDGLFRAAHTGPVQMKIMIDFLLERFYNLPCICEV